MMEKQRIVIHPLSGIAPLPEFELWSVPPTQTSVLHDIVTDVRPLAAVSASQPIEFIVNTAPDEYINMSETYLHLKARVRLSREDKLEPAKADWDSVVPAQYFLHSIFSQCELRIGDKEVTLSPQTYHYRAFIDALLAFSTSAKRSYMSASMWNTSKAVRNETVRPSAEATKEGRWFQLEGRLHTDLTFQQKNLIGGVELRIKLIPNDPKLYFTCNEGLLPSLEIVEAVLRVRKAKVSPSLLATHSQVLEDANARYAITRSEVRYQGIPRGQLDAILDNVIRGQMPRRIFVFLVDTQTFNGSYSKDPFNFKHFDVNFACAYIDGTQYPSTPYSPNFDDGLYMREYMALYIALNQNRTDTYTDLDYKSFANDKAIFAFDFAPDLSNGPGSSGHANCLTNGTLRLHFRFKRQLPEAVNVLIYCEFDNMIKIDANRNAHTNYN